MLRPKNVRIGSNRKKIAVIRALDVRLIQAEYAARFRKLQSVFISDYRKEIFSYSKKVGLDYKDVPLVPSTFFDPISIIFGKSMNKSWLYFHREKLEKILKNVDVIQIQEPYFIYAGQIADYAKKYKKPLICAPWTSFLHFSTYLPPYSFSVKKSVRQTDLFITRSKKNEKDYLSHFKIPDSKKVLIYHGIDLERFYPARKDGGEVVKILFTGHLVQHKGIDDLLDVFPKIIKEIKSKVQLVICGDGGYESKIREMAKTLPIKFLGYIPNFNLPKVYQDADIYCGPSKDWYSFGIKRTEEGFGFVFLEAMASGLPVVTNRCGAIEEAVGEDNFLNKQGDKEGLKKSLVTLINDEKLRHKMGKNNRVRVNNMFDINKQVANEEREIIKRFG